MEKIYVSADAGCVAVRTGASTLMIPNGYGDGLQKIYEMTNKEFHDYQEEHKQYELKYTYILFAKFNNAKVMTYDCFDDDDNDEDHVALTLNGVYSIYRCYGKVYFVKER